MNVELAPADAALLRELRLYSGLPTGTLSRIAQSLRRGAKRAAAAEDARSYWLAEIAGLATALTAIDPPGRDAPESRAAWDRASARFFAREAVAAALDARAVAACRAWGRARDGSLEHLRAGLREAVGDVNRCRAHLDEGGAA